MSTTWTPFFFSDFIADTRHLTLNEKGAYIDLLGHYALTEEPLTTEITSLYRVTGALTPEEQQAVQSVLKQFFTLDAGVYRNKKMDEVIERQRQIQDRNTENGKKGGRPKNPNKTQTETQTITQKKGNPTPDPQPDPDPSPIPKITSSSPPPVAMASSEIPSAVQDEYKNFEETTAGQAVQLFLQHKNGSLLKNERLKLSQSIGKWLALIEEQRPNASSGVILSSWKETLSKAPKFKARFCKWYETTFFQALEDAGIYIRGP